MNRRFHPRIYLAFLVALCLFGLSSTASSKVFRIAVITPGGVFAPAHQGLEEGLARAGYKQGQNVTFIVENTKGAVSGLSDHVNRAIEAKPDVIFTVTTALSVSAKKATNKVPVVFSWVSDPVASGLIPNYSSSKNNVTGVTSHAGPLSGKRLEILKEFAPGIKQVLALVSPKEAIARDSLRYLEEAAKKLQVKLIGRDVTDRRQIEMAVADTPKKSVDAIYHVPSTLVGSHIEMLIRKAKDDKIPLVTHEAFMAERGALLSYGPDARLCGAQAARLVAKILRGEKPSDIPAETPDKLLLVLNMTTAKAIGLKIPRKVVDRVDRVVE